MTYFSQAAPDDFGAFDSAFIALFRLSAGDSWIESLPARGPDGAIHTGAVAYHATYVLIVNWTLLPIRREAGWIGAQSEGAGRGDVGDAERQS